jgi:tripartite-type tricarboxylate transporter receptor subunit TctC
MTTRRAALAALAAGAALPNAAHAQPAWPAAKPISLVVPFTAGGNVDSTARLVAQKLEARLKQTLVIENVPGAGGLVGVGRVAQAAPDGYTLVMAFDGPIAITRHVNPQAMRFDPSRDLVPVALTTTAPMVLVAKPTLPASTMAEFIALAKREPGRLSYATSGIGTVLHLAMEMIKDRARIFVVHIPYRGGAQIATDVIGNQVDLAMVVSTSATPHVLAGRMKALAVTGRQRLPQLPGVPTLAETPALAGIDVTSWTGVFAPAKTPQPIVERLNAEILEVLKADDVRGKLVEGGATPGSLTAPGFAKFVADEQQRFAKIVKSANIQE